VGDLLMMRRQLLTLRDLSERDATAGSRAAEPLGVSELADPAYGLDFHRAIAPDRSRLAGLASAISRIPRPDRSPERSLGGR
jgi:hypothetical protein